MLISVFIILVGLSLGSFLSVLVFRLSLKEGGIVTGRSRCPNCRHRLAWYDLLPLLSFVLLAGRCRHCRRKISPAYPLLELTTALTLLTFSRQINYQFDVQNIILTVFLLVFVAIIFSDILFLTIPDKLIIPAAVLAAVSGIFFQMAGPFNLLITGLTAAGIFGIMFLASRGRWLGLGDIKMVMLIGFLFGFPTAFWIILLSIWLAAFWGIGLVFLKRATMKTALPLGAFLSATAIIFIIFQNETQFFLQRFF